MELSARFDRALTVASDLHRQQVRKGSDIPYISHLLGVCSLVLEYGGDEDCAIVALLHDAIEDQGSAETREKIRDFGERVVGIVEACSETEQIPKPPWRERKEAYIAHIPNMSDEVALVSVADKVHNASSIIKDYRVVGEEIWERFKGKKEGTLWYYRALTDAFRQRKVTPIVEELTKVVEQLESLSSTPTGSLNAR